MRLYFRMHSRMPVFMFLIIILTAFIKQHKIYFMQNSICMSFNARITVFTGTKTHPERFLS